MLGLTFTGAPAFGTQSARQASVSSATSSAPLVDSLTTEHVTDPLGIGTSNPLLSWVITSAARGVAQTKYEVRVAENVNDLVSGQNLAWDSHVVTSGQSFDIPYAGTALTSQTRYYWQVRVWDNQGNVSRWSQPAWFETAFLNPSQFQGNWIGQFPDSQQQNATKGELLFRKRFSLASDTIRRARLYIAGLSYPYPDINGHPVSNNYLDTPFTSYGKVTNWQVEQGSLHAAGGETGILKQGSSWTDYTMAFSTSIAADQSGWVVRAQSADTNYLLILDASNDAFGPKNTLQELADQGGSYHLISNVSLPFTVNPGTWYAIKTVTSGSSVTTSINGTQVASFDSGSLPSGVQPIAAGTVGFREDSGGAEQASFKDLSVTSSSGTTLFSSPLDQASDISAFQAPGTSGATVDYSTYDVTNLLQQGANALSVSLGHGFYSSGADDYPTSGQPWQPTQPKLKLELKVWYTNGQSAQVVSDGTWKVSTGPVTADTPAAQSTDARLAKPGWRTVGYNDSGWPSASVVSGPDAVLRSSLIPPVQVTGTIKPVKVTSLPGVTVPVPSYAGTPAANWIWNTANSGSSAAVGTIYLRKKFTTPSGVTQAVLRVNADNSNITYVNGTQVASGNNWQTSQIVDITKDLNPAGQPNVIAVAATNVGSSANPAGAIAAIQIQGSNPETIVTDTTWKAWPSSTANPPVSSTPPASNWNTVGYDDSAWEHAFSAGAYGVSPWDSNITPPTGPSKVYAFPITTSGWARITMQGTAGTKVYIQYSEQLNSDGTVQREGNGSAGQTDTYILRGGGPETYDPVFGWKGYEYVQVSTDPGTPLPQILSIDGVIAHTNLPASGNFTSSSKLLNTMHNAMTNTILNNQYSYGSDTPVYEKGGWTNDNADYSVSEMANFGAESYYQHMMRNFDDSQALTGNIGFMVPTPPGNQSAVDPLWGGSFLLIEYNMYENYDDLAVIRRDYSHMAAYMNYLTSLITPDGYIYQGTTFGDWSVPSNANPPSSQMLGSMFLYREARDLATMAAAIGNTSGASKYASLAATIRAAINKEFYDAGNHAYRDPLGLVSHAIGGPNGTITSTAYDQTANVIGLTFGLAPASDRQAIASGLAANVVADGNHLATGANGSKFILPVLTQAGYGDLAYKVATNPTYPGWGQWFQQCGATTMWEAWSCTNVRSHDHAFMGTVDDWLYQNVAGIQATSPGFRTVAISPSPVGDLTYASAYETTPLGRVSSSWTREGTRFALTTQIPVGSQATVCIPAASAHSVTESGNPVGQASGVTVIGMQGWCLQVRVGSGTYRFASTMS
ncbi:MAG: family 78 glycoside hydrolase catalytic domain [Streptosporangiaceae bacterium]